MPVPIVTEGWPLEAFVGDVVVCTLKGEHLDQVKQIKVVPAGQGITTTFGDPTGKTPDPQASAAALTVTFEITAKTYPGEKRILLISEEGESDPLPFLIMM